MRLENIALSSRTSLLSAPDHFGGSTWHGLYLEPILRDNAMNNSFHTTQKNLFALGIERKGGLLSGNLFARDIERRRGSSHVVELR
jgi:hypothetical protein